MTAECHALSSCSSVRPQSYPRQREPGWNGPGKALCHLPIPRPSRRRRRPSNQHSRTNTRTRSWVSTHSFMFAVILGVLLFCERAEAGNVRSANRAEGRADLLFDRSEPPVPRMRIKRHEDDTVLPSSIPASTASSQATGSSSASSTLQTESPSSQDALPRPFDTSLGNNFTAPSCPAFFESFLTNETFNDCLPFSLLLQVCSCCPAVFLRSPADC